MKKRQNGPSNENTAVYLITNIAHPKQSMRADVSVAVVTRSSFPKPDPYPQDHIPTQWRQARGSYRLQRAPLSLEV
jgi:hypothetical protein